MLFRDPRDPPSSTRERPAVSGKLLTLRHQTLFVRGVTYGTFRPRSGHEYPDRIAVEKDFSLMAANGINAVRTYTVPPTWLLDAAEQQGLLVMVGIPSERYVGYLTDRRGAPSLGDVVRRGVAACAGHPAVLCYSLGNEIPSPIVRWHGRWHIERFLEGLYRAAKEEDPQGLVTYVSYPSTEYLELPFLDLVSMNVYLEAQQSLESYLARLQNLAGERPLLMAELGLDALRNGEDKQAQVLEWQVRTAFAAGCAGAFVYAWTDEWHRGGEDVDDWEFGLVRRDRSPKRALQVVSRAFAEIPFRQERRWPRISVVVCSYNGSRTIRECLEGIERLEYPDYEVIVVDDGSTDDTAKIASDFDVRLIRTAQNGLSNARNTGMEAATGEIVAYLDDDAWPDPHWLTYLAEAFERTGCVAAGGPNVSPPEDGFVASCVNDAPGNPTHVLLSDREAEHLPGCNLAIRVEKLKGIGGFDPYFRTAGDDVDVCWRLRDAGGSLAFHAAALVWHHRRGSLRAFWKQQKGYGRSEALLEAKWPEKYNGAGHLSWNGRVYGGAPLLGRTRIYHGVWGSAPFQSIYGPADHSVFAYALTPEWHLAVLGLSALACLGLSWPPLLVAAPLVALMIATSLARAGSLAARASGVRRERSPLRRARRWVLTSFLQLFQPVARTLGRVGSGLTPWRRSPSRERELARPRRLAFWSEQWRAATERLSTLEARLRDAGFCVFHGGPFDRFDLEVRSGTLGAARLLMAAEEHGGGCQLVRLHVRPRVARTGLLLLIGLVGFAVGATLGEAWWAAVALGAAAGALLLRMTFDCACAAGAAMNVIGVYAESEGLRRIVHTDRARR